MKRLMSIDRWKRVTFNPCRLFRDPIVICTNLWILCFFRIIHIWFFDKAWQPSKPKSPFGVQLSTGGSLCVQLSPHGWEIFVRLFWTGYSSYVIFLWISNFPTLQFIYQTRVHFLIYQEFPSNKWGLTHNRRKNGQKSMHSSQKS